MKAYEKPTVLRNEDMAEGVYAASGADCWSGDITSVQDWNGSHHVFEARIVHSTAVEHISTACTITMKFSNVVTNAYSENDWQVDVNGDTVTVRRPSHANAYKSGDNVTYKVWVQAADEATTKAISGHITSFSCDKAVNVQGGGADGN